MLLGYKAFHVNLYRYVIGEVLKLFHTVHTLKILKIYNTGAEHREIQQDRDQLNHLLYQEPISTSTPGVNI